MALPPARSTSAPARLASACGLATMPPGDVAGAGAAARAGESVAAARVSPASAASLSVDQAVESARMAGTLPQGP